MATAAHRRQGSVNILIAVDMSPVTKRVMASARMLARAMDAHAYLLHVAEPEPDFVGFDAGPDVVRDQMAAEFRREHRQIQALAADLRSDGLEATALLVQGAIVETILNEAERQDAAMIVLGSHGRGAVVELLVGSACEGIVRKSTRPVLVVPSG